MKLLLDQDVYAVTARFLEELGHDVVRVGELGLHQADDTVLLAYSSFYPRSRSSRASQGVERLL